MSEKITRIRNLIDTSKNWKARNPLLLEGELGIEVKPDGEIAVKIGDGLKPWNMLDYIYLSAEKIAEIQMNLQNQIDNIVISASSSGDVSAEVAQARVAVDGTSYETLSQRINADENKINDIDLTLQGFLGETTIDYTLESHHYYSIDSETEKAVKSEYNTYSCCALNVSVGEVYLLTLRERSTAVDYIIAVDDEDNVISSDLHGTTSTTQRTDYEFIVPSGATKLYVSTFYPESTDQFGIKRKEVKASSSVTNAISSLNTDVQAINVVLDGKASTEYVESSVDKVDSHVFATMKKIGVPYTHTKKTYKYVDDNGNVATGSSDNYYSCMINVKEGEVYSITLQERSTSVDYIIAANDSDVAIDSKLHGTTSTTQRTDYMYTIPSGATRLYLTSFLPESFAQFHVAKYVQKNAIEISGEGTTYAIPLSWGIGNIPESSIEYNYAGRLKNDEYVSFSGEIGIVEPPAGYEINVLWFDENYEMKGYSGFKNSTYIFDATKYPYYRFTQKATDGSMFDDATVGMPFVKCFTQIKAFKGLKFSVLGDSISSFDRSGSYNGFADGTDILPSGNKIYYDGTNAGVTDISQMWWSKVSLMLGMERLVINAWSGSKVSSIDATVSNFTPMSDVARCQALHKGDVNPDVIFFWGGTNDFSKANANIGSWNGGVYPTSNDDFSKAYALAIKRMQEKYPDAKIYCFSLATICRTKTSANGSEISSDGKSIADYNAVIKRMCDIFGCQYVELDNIGFNRFNMYPDYCQDSETVPTHPNDNGMTMYAKRIVSEIVNHTI